MKFKLRYFLEDDFSNYQALANNRKIAKSAGMKILTNAFEQWMAFKGMVGRQGFLAIVNEADQVVGGIFIFKPAAEDIYEIGYLLGEEYWNQGIMSKAVHFAIKNLKNRNKRDFKVFANVCIDNYASQQVLKRNGFKRLEKITTGISGYDQSSQKEYRYELNVKLLE